MPDTDLREDLVTDIDFGETMERLQKLRSKTLRDVGWSSVGELHEAYVTEAEAAEQNARLAEQACRERDEALRIIALLLWREEGGTSISAVEQVTLPEFDLSVGHDGHGNLVLAVNER